VHLDPIHQELQAGGDQDKYPDQVRRAISQGNSREERRKGNDGRLSCTDKTDKTEVIAEKVGCNNAARARCSEAAPS
jgi:hypothetical protein